MRASAFFLPILLLIICITTLQARIIHVPADSVTIQSGIYGAVNGDTVLVANGTYTGDGNRDIDFGGKAIVVMSENGPEVTIVDCEGDSLDPYRGFYFRNGEDSTSVLQGFTITNGYADYYGGGIYNSNSSPTIINCTLIGNEASCSGGVSEGGGGMYNWYSSPTVTNCTFSENGADFGTGGGGMYNEYSSPTVTNCTFSENGALGGGGGGICNMSNSNSTVTNCTFSGNTASRGCGIYSSSSSPMVTNCTFSGNRSGDSGGGMYNVNSSPTVTNCTFSGNSARYGGGIYNNSSSPAVTNCTINGNTTDFGGSGGGMYNVYSSPTVTNCTFSGNMADFPGKGGGMYNVNNSSPTVTNSILWGDIGDEIYNSSSSPTVTYSDVQGGYTGEGNINADPLFVDPDSSDYHLQPGSPCIDSGDSTILDACRPPGLGEERSDMGVYGGENNCGWLGILYVPDDYLTIQGAIDASWDSAIIIVSPGTYVENIDFFGKAITVMSERGADSTIIDGNQSGSVVTFQNGEGPGSILNGFTITNGNGYSGFGGGIYCYDSSPNLRNNLIVGNSTYFGGGGIYCDYYSSPTINNNTIIDNLSGCGGAIACYESSCPTIENTICWGNIAFTGQEIFLADSSDLTISYSDVKGGQDSVYVESGSSLDWGEGMIVSDPLFIAPGIYDCHVDICSPVINAGYADYAPSPGETDMDGEDRIMNGRIDMGTDEVLIVDRNKNNIHDNCEGILIFEPESSDSTIIIDIGDFVR
jgi:hypothetical protein